MKKYYKGTRNVIEDNLEYIKGKTLDLGAGSCKYKGLILKSAKEYISLDMFYNNKINIVADIHNTGLPSNEFNTILCTQVLEHIEKPTQVIVEIKRLLKSGGICLMTVPFLYPHHADPVDYFRYSKEGLEKLFLNEDFKIIKSDKYGGFFSLISNIIKENFISSYKKHLKIKVKLFDLIISGFLFIDKYISPQKVYSNVFIIAQKK